MKKNANRILLAAVLTVFVVSCSSIDTPVRKQAPETHAVPQGTPRIQTGITYTNRGSTSEIRYHFINIDGIKLPDVFNAVSIGAITYTFAVRAGSAGDEGYLVIPQPSEALSGGGEISLAERERGWYEGIYRKKNTPESWISGTRAPLDVFFDPHHVMDVVKAYKLLPLR